MQKLLTYGRLFQAMQISEDSYKVLTQEFLSTVTVNVHVERDYESVITFHMAGRPQQISFDEFSIACGFYNAYDRHDSWFQQLVPTRATPIHLGYLVAHAFYLMSTKAPSALLGGAYITRVASNFQLLHFDRVRSHPPQRQGRETHMSMSLIHWIDGLLGHRLVPTPDGLILGGPVDDVEEAELNAMMETQMRRSSLRITLM
ncbi:hypothetical protein LINGRAHAP2_LOCUS14150 [Linum grandiflorum]